MNQLIPGIEVCSNNSLLKYDVGSAGVAVSCEHKEYYVSVINKSTSNVNEPNTL